MIHYVEIILMFYDLIDETYMNKTFIVYDLWC